MEWCAACQLDLFTLSLSYSLRAKIRVSVEHYVYREQEKGGWFGAKLGQSGRILLVLPLSFP